jgi:hypothetical protein
MRASYVRAYRNVAYVLILYALHERVHVERADVRGNFFFRFGT